MKRGGSVLKRIFQGDPASKKKADPGLIAFAWSDRVSPGVPTPPPIDPDANIPGVDWLNNAGRRKNFSCQFLPTYLRKKGISARVAQNAKTQKEPVFMRLGCRFCENSRSGFNRFKSCRGHH